MRVGRWSLRLRGRVSAFVARGSGSAGTGSKARPVCMIAYRPQTNGKAERFIRTLLNGWAYGAIYRSSQERTRRLDGWLWHYNHQRRHSALSHQPPITRTNLLGSYI